MAPILEADDPRAVAAAAAIRAGDLARLHELLRAHPELATAELGSAEPCRSTESLLHVATEWPGHRPNVAATIATLVAAGADVNARFTGLPHRETPLHSAASSDDVEALDALLDAGADIEADGAVIADGTPLDDAVAFGQWRAARRLIDHGAYAKLFNAAALGLLDRVHEHLAADPPPAEVTASFWAACHGGQRATADVLLRHGADRNWVAPWDGLTPLDAARRSGADDLAGWLTAQGARTAAEVDAPNE
jgi:ankyrin repeat protein